MSSAREELEIANQQLASAEAFIEAIDSVGSAKGSAITAAFLSWLRGARIERAAAIREALDGEPLCSCCNNTLTCRACSWGA